jgi:DNA-binding Lrp family transcriptional regulator
LEAYILVNSVPRMVWEIAEAALKIEGVKMAHAVTGQFDVIAYAEFANMDALREIIGKFMSLNGVQRTQTAIVISPVLT